jgi:hypothetical protein
MGEEVHTDVEEDMVDVNYHEGEEEEYFEFPEIHEPELEIQEERDRFYQEVRIIAM